MPKQDQWQGAEQHWLPLAEDGSRHLSLLYLCKISHFCFYYWILTPSRNTVSKNNCNILPMFSASLKKILSAEESFILHPKQCSNKTHALVGTDLEAGWRCTELGLRLPQRVLVVSKYSLKETLLSPFNVPPGFPACLSQAQLKPPIPTSSSGLYFPCVLSVGLVTLVVRTCVTCS